MPIVDAVITQEVIDPLSVLIVRRQVNSNSYGVLRSGYSLCKICIRRTLSFEIIFFDQSIFC